MVKFFYGLVLSVAFSLFGGEVFAQSVDEESLDDHFGYVSTEEVFSDYYNKAMGSVFGRESLLESLPFGTSDEVKSEIRDLSQEEFSAYLEPFNFMAFDVEGSSGGVMVSYGLVYVSIVIMVALLYIGFMSTTAIFTSLLSSQFSGSFISSKINKSLFISKLVLILFFLVPSPVVFQGKVSFENPPILSLILKIGGLSNRAASLIYGDFVKESPRSSPYVVLPRYDSRTLLAEQMLFFSICSLTEGSDFDGSRSFSDSGDNKFSLDIGVGSCELGVHSQIPSYLEDGEKSAISSAAILSMGVDYDKLTRSAIAGATQAAIDRALEYSRFIVKSVDRLKREGHQVALESDSVDSFFVKPYSDVGSYCDSLTTESPVSVADLYRIIEYSKSCISKEIVEYIVYPDPSSVSVSGLNSSVPGLVFCESVVPVGDGERSQLVEGDIESCVREYCSAAGGGKYSGSYLCAYGAALFDYDSGISGKIANAGWLTAGASIYGVFTEMPAPNFAKQPFNTLVAVFDEVNDKRPRIQDVSLFPTVSGGGEYAVSLKKGVFEHDLKFTDYYSFVVASAGWRLAVDSEEEGVVENPVLSVFDFIDDGFLGINRLYDCLENPMKVSPNSRWCGNTVNEVGYFGSRIFKTFVVGYTWYFASEKGFNFADFLQRKTGSKLIKKFSGETVQKGLSGAVLIGSFAMIVQDILESSGYDYFASANGESTETQYVKYGLFFGALGSLFGSSLFSGLTGFLLFVIFSISMVATFVIPLIPLFIFYFAVFNFWFIFCYAIVFGPMLLSRMFIGGEDEGKGIFVVMGRIFFKLLISAPMYIVGLIFAWILSNLVMTLIFSQADIFTAINYTSSNSILGIIDSVVVLFVFVIVYYFVFTAIFGLIEGLFTFADGFINQSNQISFSGKDRISELTSYGDAKKALQVSGIKGI